MSKADDMKKELLKQMERDSDREAEVSPMSAWDIVDKHKAQLRKLKWIAITGWIIALVGAAALHNLKAYLFKNDIDSYLTDSEFWLIRYSDMALIVAIIIPILLTYLVYVKSKTLTMLQICARLANIEEQLKKISQIGSSDS